MPRCAPTPRRAPPLPTQREGAGYTAPVSKPARPDSVRHPPEAPAWEGDVGFGDDDEPAPPREVSPPPMRYGGARGERQRAAAQRSFENDDELLLAATAPRFSVSSTAAETSAAGELDDFGRRVLPHGVRRRLVLDESGERIAWPWQSDARPVERAPQSSRADPAAAYFAELLGSSDGLGTHRADATVLAGLRASTTDGKMGESSIRRDTD